MAAPLVVSAGDRSNTSSPNCGASNTVIRAGKYHVTRAGFAVAVIALVSTVALATEECCTSTQAQTQTAPPESTIWDHNGSVMYLVANGSSREIFYQKPRPGMLDAGARPGSLLFRGEINNGQYLGTAYIFNLRCGPIPFEVKGPILDANERIVLTGQTPRVGQNCRAYESYTSNLEFRRLKSTEAVQSKEPLAAAQPPAAGVSKTEVPPRTADELPSTAKAQPSVKNETPVAPKDTSTGLADPKIPSTSTAQASVTNEMTGAMDLDKIKWGAAIIVMIAWLLIVFFGKILIRRTA
jgi:hypothetical protein